MRKKYDALADALYVTVRKGKVHKTRKEGAYLVDYDKKGNLLGLEILNYSKKERPTLKRIRLALAA